MIGAEAQCPKATGVACDKDGKCPKSHGPSSCNNGFCECDAGSCSYEGYCQSSCAAMTEGTCKVTACHGWRGDTKCESGKCECKEDACMVSTKVVNYVGGQRFHMYRQECKRKCVTRTGGGCTLFPCKADRGPTICQSHGLLKSCVCQPGYCAIPYGIQGELRCVPSGESLSNSTLLTSEQDSDSTNANTGNAPLIVVLLASCSAAALLAAVAFRARKGRTVEDEELYRPL